MYFDLSRLRLTMVSFVGRLGRLVNPRIREMRPIVRGIARNRKFVAFIGGVKRAVINPYVNDMIFF
jgi:hypothetical protein